MIIEIGNKIRQLRTERGMTQERLGDLLGGVLPGGVQMGIGGIT